MHAFDSFRFYPPSPCVVDVVHVDRIVGKISHIIVWSMLLNIEHDSFSRIVNTRFIDKTINFTTAYCNNDFSTPSPTLPLSQGGAGAEVGERGPGAPEGRARKRALITLDVLQSFRNSQYTPVYTVICYSQCATVSVQQSMCNRQCTTVAFTRCNTVSFRNSLYTLIQ